MNKTTSFPAFIVRKDADGRVTARVERLTADDLPPGDVIIRVAYSSLNYKDALASQGHPGVVRTFPHVPGIDCAGTVEDSTSPDYRPGDQVIITGYDLGSGHWGGYAEFVRVPAEWIVPLSSDLTLRETMIYGTAGFTAAQCVSAITVRESSPVTVRWSSRDRLAALGRSRSRSSRSLATKWKRLPAKSNITTGCASLVLAQYSIATTWLTTATVRCFALVGQRLSTRLAENRWRRSFDRPNIAAASRRAAWLPAPISRDDLSVHPPRCHARWHRLGQLPAP